MSTSYYIYCRTCHVDVTDPNGYDNTPELIECMVKNIIPYTHLALMIEELPVPYGTGPDYYEIIVMGHTLQLRNLRKHCTHQLVGLDEYGYEIMTACTGCKARHCGPWAEGKKCCPECSHLVYDSYTRPKIS
jgi:hypothetical protein